LPEIKKQARRLCYGETVFIKDINDRIAGGAASLPVDSVARPCLAILTPIGQLLASLAPKKLTVPIAMTSHRFLIAIVAISLSFSVRSVRSQEAVESRPDQSPEKPSLELTPTSTEQPTETKPAETTPETTAEETGTGTKKKKKAALGQSGQVLQDSMTAQEFKSAGLEKLSAEELQNLNAWLQGYRRTTETKATEKATAAVTAEVTKKVKAETRRSLDTVETRVDGTVPHLTGHSIIKLEDGSMWKQANPEDRYASPPIDHPTAVVTHTMFGYKMRISGLPEFYVDPVR
jgi:hypothetical protein